MAGLLNALNAGKTSMITNQKAMEIIGNNISNVNTPGYSRQTPQLSPLPTLSFGDFFVGQGVRVGSIERAHDSFITSQINNKSADFGQATAKSVPLSSVERALPVDDRGLTATIDRFFDSWQELSSNPDGQVERQQVLQNGQLVANAFQSTYADLESVRTDIDQQLDSKVDGINQHLQEIADLNQRISAIELAGNNANSDRDRRDLLISELATTMGIQTVESEDKTVSLQLPSGVPLLSGTNPLQVETVLTGSVLGLQVKMGSTVIPLDASKVDGELHGLLDVRDNLIPDLMNRLDLLAYDFGTAVNLQHQAGSGLDGISGRNFFTLSATTAGTASTISVALTNNDQVAAGTNGSPGDNTNALLLAQVKHDRFVAGNDTYTSWFGKMAATVGMEVNQNELARTGLEDTMTQLNNVRDATAGVSLEEEMVNLIQYQKGFEASAKFLATVDEMMSTLLTIKR